MCLCRRRCHRPCPCPCTRPLPLSCSCLRGDSLVLVFVLQVLVLVLSFSWTNYTTWSLSTSSSPSSPMSSSSMACVIGSKRQRQVFFIPSWKTDMKHRTLHEIQGRWNTKQKLEKRKGTSGSTVLPRTIPIWTIRDGPKRRYVQHGVVAQLLVGSTAVVFVV